MASDETCEELITRKVLCFLLDALDSSLEAFEFSRIESRSSSFEGLSTHLHGTVPHVLTFKS